MDLNPLLLEVCQQEIAVNLCLLFAKSANHDFNEEIGHKHASEDHVEDDDYLKDWFVVSLRLHSWGHRVSSLVHKCHNTLCSRNNEQRKSSVSHRVKAQARIDPSAAKVNAIILGFDHGIEVDPFSHLCRHPATIETAFEQVQEENSEEAKE